MGAKFYRRAGRADGGPRLTAPRLSPAGPAGVPILGRMRGGRVSTARAARPFAGMPIPATFLPGLGRP